MVLSKFQTIYFEVIKLKNQIKFYVNFFDVGRPIVLLMHGLSIGMLMLYLKKSRKLYFSKLVVMLVVGLYL